MRYIFANIGNVISLLILMKKNVCVFYLKINTVFNSCYINFSILALILINGYRINFQNNNVLICKMFHYLVCYLQQ